MNGTIRGIVAAVLLLAVAGCSRTTVVNAERDQAEQHAGETCHNKPLQLLLDATELKKLFEGIAAEMCQDACPGGVRGACADRAESGRETVIVTDFADLQTFLPNKSGLLMGELMRGSLNKVCGYRIKQAEFGSFFKLSDNGLLVLTRKVNEIKDDEFTRRDAVVGTYNYLNNGKIVVFARTVDTRTGTVTTMVTRELSYDCNDNGTITYTVK